MPVASQAAYGPNLLSRLLAARTLQQIDDCAKSAWILNGEGLVDDREMAYLALVIEHQRQAILFSIPQCPFYPFSGSDQASPLDGKIPQLGFGQSKFLQQGAVCPAFFQLFQLMLQFYFRSLQSRQFGLQLLHFQIILFVKRHAFLRIAISIQELLAAIDLFIQKFLALEVLFLLLLQRQQLVELGFGLCVGGAGSDERRDRCPGA